LATSDKNEAHISDLKDGLLDFLDQLGHKEGDYDSRLWFGGGDGMSYNNMLILKKYMQTHPDQFQRFELLRPILKVWHTQWTNLTRIIQTHSGGLLSNNPATIRWAAKKIGRNISGDKKSDFYPDSQLLALLHDTQMLDGWRFISINTPSGMHLLMRNNLLLRVYFKTDDIIQYLDKPTIPSFEELEIGAKFIFDAFTSSKAQYKAMDDRTPENPPRCMCQRPDIFGALRLMYVSIRTFSAPQICSSVCRNPDIFDTQIKVCVRVRTFWQVLSWDGLELKILKSRRDGLIV
jgi:hypothetical protein